MQSYRSKIDQFESRELFLLENLELDIDLNNVDRQLFINLDREYNEKEKENAKNFFDDIWYIRRVLHDEKVRSLRHMHQTRDELKIEYFDKEYVVEIFNKSHVFFFYLLFVDEFEIHRNMYRFLKAFYLISICLFYRERRKIVNIFTLTLKSHDVDIKNVVEVIRKSIQELNVCFEIEINDVLEQVCAYNMIFLDDMSQQAENERFFQHQINMRCRICLCTKVERDNLEYDTILNDKNHWETTKQRQDALDQIDKDQKLFVQEIEIKIELPLIVKLTSILNLILSRTYDASHFEWRELDRILQSYLMTSILSKHERFAYLKSFQNFRYSSDWFRIFSSSLYIWFWSLFEFERVNLLTPLILRKHAFNTWFRQSFVLVAERVLIIETIVARVIIKVFDVIANANILIESQRYIDHLMLRQIVLQDRQAYQDLIRCAIESVKSFDRIQKDHENQNENLSDVNSLTNNDSHQDEDLLTNILSNVESMKDSKDMNFLLISSQTRKRVKQKRRRSSRKKFEKLLTLSNVHAELHLIDMTREYATVMNLSVLTEEMKYMWVLFQSRDMTNEMCLSKNVQSHDKSSCVSQSDELSVLSRRHWSILSIETCWSMRLQSLKSDRDNTISRNALSHIYSKLSFSRRATDWRRQWQFTCRCKWSSSSANTAFRARMCAARSIADEFTSEVDEAFASALISSRIDEHISRKHRKKIVESEL